ncbi:MAG: hypothetical protein H7Y18_05750, partial [Clostridiaceae bacterium]|nr:hypothetical protein [Clostridiaceae bacterium]
MYDSKMLDDVYNMLVNANYKLVHIWITQIVFSWRWWIGTFLSVVPWIVWIKIGDKKNAPKLLFVGLVVMLVTT